LKTIATLAAAITLAAGSAHASSTSVDWGALGAGASRAGVGFPTGGSFLDTYRFSISDAFLDSSVAVSNNILPAYGIASGSYSLFSFGANNLMGDADDALFGGSWSFDGTTGSLVNTVSLTAGNYYFAVSGITTGLQGGFYTITTAIAPIPEPEIYGMLLAGMALMGFLARRRQRLSAA
jgi:hypothetical protein